MDNGSDQCFYQVNANDEWALIGAALGFQLFPSGEAGQPARCGPAVAHRLQQLYTEVLRHFDQAYINSVVARMRASGQIPSQPPQPQAQQHQPTEADYQALLTTITSESSLMTSEAMSILPRFSHTSGAELEAHRVPQHVIAFIEQNREHLQRTAQDQSGFRAGLTSTKNPPLDNRTQVNQGSTLQTMSRLPQLIHGHQQLQRQGLVPGQGRSNPLQPGQLFNTTVGAPIRPSTAQSANGSSISSMGAQMNASSSGAQNQGGPMTVPMNPAGVNSVPSGSVVPQSAGPMQIQNPTTEELIAAKRWVDEQKKLAFSRGQSSLLPSSAFFDLFPFVSRL
jgi:hypothetical protein